MPTIDLRTRRALTCTLTLVLLCAAAPGAQPGPARPATGPVSLKSITVSPDGLVVSIEADGPLPEPVAGHLQAPPRIYVDFAGVKPGTVKAITTGGPVVSGVRVALNSADPVVTRVVVDLTGNSTYRIDGAERQKRRITVTFGAGSARVTPPVTPPPTTPRAPAPSPAPSGATPPGPAAAPPKPAAVAPEVAAARTRYVQQVSPSLSRLQELMLVLTAIEKLDPSIAPTDLQSSARTFETIGRELAAIKAPAPAVVQHDMLQRACELATRAARLRADSLASRDPSTTANASSAAAGAVMLITRARQELATPQ